jgi:hypothetical protein
VLARRLTSWIVFFTIAWLMDLFIAPIASADERLPVSCRVLIVAFVGGLGTASFPPTMATPILNEVRALDLPGVCVKTVSTYWPWSATRWVRKQLDATRKARLIPVQTPPGSQAQSRDLSAEPTKISETGNHPRIIVFGYSLGASHAFRFARTMQREGKPIELLLTVDTKGPTKGIVPANVKKAANFYERWLYPFFYPLYYGKKDVRAEDPATTKFLGNIQVLHAGHFTIVKASPARQLLCEAVRATFESEPTPSAP